MKLYTYIFEFSLGGNTIYEYLRAFVWLIGFLLVLKIFREIVLFRLKKLAQRTKTDIDDMIVHIIKSVRPHFYTLVSFYFALRTLTFENPIVYKVINGFFLVIIVYQIVQILQEIAEYSIKKWIGSAGAKRQDQSTAQALKLVIKIILWIVGGLLILSNLDFNVSSLVASLGIGGIAVALAAQNILEDLFSSFSIYFDKPFEVGDFIVVGTDKGTVEKIGLKTTRIHTLLGEELVISNKELTNARIQNFKKMKKRRVNFILGVTYDTPKFKLEKIPKILKEIISSQKLAEFDRAHFSQFADSSLNFEIVYYVDTNDYTVHMDILESINLAIKDRFEKEKIEFAYPTRTIFVNK